MARSGLWFAGLGLAFYAASTTMAGAQPAAKPMISLQMEALPGPVAVTLNPAKTAILLMDVVQPICGAQPQCTEKLMPNLLPFLAKARAAGVTIAYGTRGDNKLHWLASVAPKPGDIQVDSAVQDRFFSTDLEQQLKAKGITTVMLAGWKVSGSVTYTAVGGGARGFTMVVPMDTTIAASEFETNVGFFQLLNLNLTNAPLKPNATTLTRTELIRFQ